MDAPSVQYVTTDDGIRIAYAAVGEGLPFVFMPGPVPMEIIWGFPRPLLPWVDGLSARFRVILHDHRGIGLSSREDSERSMAGWVRDIEAVVRALGVTRFVLFAAAGFGHAALHYALAHPQSVMALIIVATPISGRAWSPAMHDVLPKEDWLLFMRSAIPSELTQDESRRYLDVMLRNSDPQGAFRGQRTALESDMQAVLAQVKAPTLVMHSRDYLQLRPEESMKLAAAIPGARFVLLDGADLIGDHEQGLRAIDEFIESLPSEVAMATVKQPPGGLSSRELDVLKLVAAGRTNPQIADELFISRNTVQNHVASILAKAGLANRAEAAAYAQRNGLV